MERPPAFAIAKPDIHDLLDTIADHPTPVLASKVFKTLRRLCGWAVDRGLSERSPCDGIKRALEAGQGSERR
jgi:hypothetical protein